MTAYYRGIVRLCDSSDKKNVKDSFREVERVNFTGKSRSTLLTEIMNYISYDGIKHPVKLKKRLLMDQKERNLIPAKDRRYDEIIGAVFDHRHFEKAYHHILRYHKKKKSKEIALFTTCASIKPYPLALSFRKLFGYLEMNLTKRELDKLHWLVVSNATAPIPEEYHYSFPFYAYETNLAKLNKKERIRFTKTVSNRLDNFLKKFKYKHYIAFLKPSSLSLQVLEKVCQANDIALLNFPTVKIKEKIISERSLLYWNFQGMKDNLVLEELRKAIQGVLADNSGN
jgi:predicted RNA-binding protein